MTTLSREAAMRDVAKSMGRFSWAMWVLGLEQLRRLVADEYSGRREQAMSEAFDSTREATEKTFSERTRKLYDAGDKLQQESVDLLFDMARPSNLGADKIVERAANAVGRSADSVREWAGDKPKPAAPSNRA